MPDTLTVDKILDRHQTLTIAGFWEMLQRNLTEAELRYFDALDMSRSPFEGVAAQAVIDKVKEWAKESRTAIEIVDSTSGKLVLKAVIQWDAFLEDLELPEGLEVRKIAMTDELSNQDVVTINQVEAAIGKACSAPVS